MQYPCVYLVMVSLFAKSEFVLVHSVAKIGHNWEAIMCHRVAPVAHDCRWDTTPHKLGTFILLIFSLEQVGRKV